MVTEKLKVDYKAHKLKTIKSALKSERLDHRQDRQIHNTCI
jgi:hypothetical protein